MSKAAVGETSNATLPFGGGQIQPQVMAKRKTPSELRGEQLKRTSFAMSANSQLPSLLPPDCNGVSVHGLKKPEPLKTAKYIDTRVSEVFPVKKFSSGCSTLNEKPKHDLLTADETTSLDLFSKMYKTTAACTNNGKSQRTTCEVEESNSERSVPVAKANTEQVFQQFGKGSQNTFRSVAELSMGSEKSSSFACIDMDKALKGLVSRDIHVQSRSKAEPSGNFYDHSSIPTRIFRSEFRIQGNRSPLDFTLKTTLRLVSSSSVRWCHRIFASGGYCPGEFSSCGCAIQNAGCNPSPSATADALFRKALNSWAYPQSSLPSSIVSAISMSTSRAEMDFLKKRQQDWEDSFRNLYYMLRKNECSIFYVYTSQFIVLFIGGNFTVKEVHSCNAFLSQSTHGLRSLLAEHDVSFSMPLCCSQVEQSTADDLVEFLEIERRNLGQTLHLDSLSDLDNSPQSLLAFLGNEKVHAFYDFLLNYRFFLNSLTSLDVPLLLAPVPFQNAAISVPEVRSKEIKRANPGSDADGLKIIPNSLATYVCYSIEIKDQIIPPWIVSRTCAAMGSQGMCFEASFTTEPKSVGLNVALDVISAKSDAPTVADGGEVSSTCCIPQTTIVQDLRASYLNGLNCVDGSFVAFATPV